jgi:hypothetical protein
MSEARREPLTVVCGERHQQVELLLQIGTLHGTTPVRGDHSLPE